MKVIFKKSFSKSLSYICTFFWVSFEKLSFVFYNGFLIFWEGLFQCLIPNYSVKKILFGKFHLPFLNFVWIVKFCKSVILFWKFKGFFLSIVLQKCFERDFLKVFQIFYLLFVPFLSFVPVWKVEFCISVFWAWKLFVCISLFFQFPPILVYLSFFWKV